uniref:Glutamate carboxypeptidase 2 n=1 Tax=Panagrellus redivivus TaxID=6233 RepID=A0A7E4V175_PANRE
MSDDGDLFFSISPPPSPPPPAESEPTRNGECTPLPRRFPFPEEYPSINEDENSTDSSRSLLRSFRRSVYDPLPNFIHPPNAPITYGGLFGTMPRPGPTNRLTPSGLYAGSVICPKDFEPMRATSPRMTSGAILSSHESTGFGKVIEESAKSKSFLIRALFAAVFVLLLVITVLLGAGAVLFFNKSAESTCQNPSGPPSSGSAIKQHNSPYEEMLWDDVGQHEALSSHLMSLFEPERVKENLRWLAKDVHVAGTEEQLGIMDRIQEFYESLDFDVTPYEYDVLLNYPDYANPNTIHHWNGADWNVMSNGQAPFAGPDELFEAEEQDPRSRVWWNAYSNNGTTIGNVVYANFGTEEDYLLLEKQNISLRGKIALVRYGGVFRGDKALGAEKRGASGVIIYSDPADFAMNGNVTFPSQIWLPKAAAQRGTLLRTFGDPETPFLPSKDYTFREFDEETLRKSGILPSIPVMPIGYEDCAKIMEQLDGPLAMWSRWRGSMNVEYRLTGSANFKLDVRSFSSRRRIKNVVAVFRGAVEPDRFVALSNHADAWVKGAIDPSSGTATLLEVAKVVKEANDYMGWRPRRSLAFCHWDAEEFGLIGSTEYVEEMLKLLQGRAVSVLNVDNVNGNGTLSVKAVPLLYRAIVKAAGKIGHPNPTEVEAGRVTLLDSWKFYSPKGPLPGDKSVPAIGLPASGSDHQRFITFAGVPVADLRLESAPVYSYMLYHTRYELPWTVENLLDPTGEVLPSMGKLWLELARSLTDSLIIPFGVEDYAVYLVEQLKRMDTQLVYLGVDVLIGEPAYRKAFKSVTKAAAVFHHTAKGFQQLIHGVNAGDRPLSLKQVEMLNSRLLSLERAFILDAGIFPEANFQRHSVFALGNGDLSSNSPFALIFDPASKLLESQTEHDSLHWTRTVRLGFSKLQYTIESATSLLALDGF